MVSDIRLIRLFLNNLRNCAFLGLLLLGFGFTLKSQDLNYDLKLLVDSAEVLSLEQILEPEVQNRFFKPSGRGFDQSSSVYWWKIDLEGSRKELVTLRTKYLDSLWFYLPQPNGSYAEFLSGEDIALAHRPIELYEHLGAQFEFQGGQVRIYLRSKSYSDFSLLLRDVKTFELIGNDEFRQNAIEARYFHGIFLGILLALMIYNLFIYTIYRDWGYAAYAIFMFTQALYHLSVTGFLTELFFASNPGIGKYSPYVIAAISLSAFIYFSQVFLNTKELAKPYHKALNFLMAFIITTNLVGYFYRIDIANKTMLLQGVAMNTLAFFAAYKAHRKKYIPARYFLMASVLAFASYAVFVAARFELLPSHFLTRYAFQISVALQSLLYAIGLADRMRRILKELALKKIEQARLEKEKETALKNILEEQKVVLEETVTERTIEIREANALLEKQNALLAGEKRKSEELLLNILPADIAEELKEKGHSDAQLIPSAAVLFTDFKGFTEMSTKISPKDLVQDLHQCFSAFDEICEIYDIEKIKTIGDAYMAAGGLGRQNKNSHSNTIKAALAMRDFIEAGKEAKIKAGLPYFEIRVGVHCGPVIAGIVGLKKFQYDIWGDTVNTASRMESHGAVGKVNISRDAFNLVREDNSFSFVNRGFIETKGKGALEMYFADRE